MKLKLYAIVVTVLLGIMLASGIAIYLGSLAYAPRKIAEFDDPAGKKYEIFYSLGGDLSFQSLNSEDGYSTVTYRDYYGSTEIVGHEWKNSDELFVQMDDGTEMTIRIPHFKIILRN